MATQNQNNDTTGTNTEGGINDHKAQGGYMALLHEIEERCYGPDSPFDAKTKVFYFIRHKTIRDWKYVKAISSREIMRATGVHRRQLDYVLKDLEDKKMIISHKSKTGRVWNPTQYALHPETFGLDTLWRGGDAPKEIEKSGFNQSFEVHPEGKIIPISSRRGGNTQLPGGGNTQLPGGGNTQLPPNELKYSELMEKLASKNPFLKNQKKEPKEKRQKEIYISEKRDRELQVKWLKETDGNRPYEEWLKANG